METKIILHSRTTPTNWYIYELQTSSELGTNQIITGPGHYLWHPIWSYDKVDVVLVVSQSGSRDWYIGKCLYLCHVIRSHILYKNVKGCHMSCHMYVFFTTTVYCYVICLPAFYREGGDITFLCPQQTPDNVLWSMLPTLWAVVLYTSQCSVGVLRTEHLLLPSINLKLKFKLRECSFFSDSLDWSSQRISVVKTSWMIKLVDVVSREGGVTYILYSKAF